MRKIALLLPLFALSPLHAAAAEIDYRYFEVALVAQDGPRDDFEGLGADVSLPFGRQFHGRAGFSATSVSSIDRNTFYFGGGYRMPLNRMTDFVAEVDFLNVDVDGREDDGLRIGAGVRSLVDPQLELRGAVRYVDLGDGELVLDLGAQYIMTAAWSGFLEVTEGDDFGGYRIGARYNF